MQLTNKYRGDYSRHPEQIIQDSYSLNAEAPIHDVPATSNTSRGSAHGYPTQTDFDGMGNPVVMNPQDYRCKTYTEMHL